MPRKIKLNRTKSNANSTQAEREAFEAFATLYAQAHIENDEFDAHRNIAEPETLDSVPAETAPDTTSEPAKAKANTLRLISHAAAALAVAAFYDGASKPFKAAGDTFAPLNFTNQKAPSRRQAALIYAMLTYAGDNIDSNGTFLRGGFVVPARLVFHPDTLQRNGLQPNDLLPAQPESGCLGNMLGRAVDYIDGPLSGAAQRTQILRFNLPIARAELRAEFGDKAVALLDTTIAQAAARETAAQA